MIGSTMVTAAPVEVVVVDVVTVLVIVAVPFPDADGHSVLQLVCSGHGEPTHLHADEI